MGSAAFAFAPADDAAPIREAQPADSIRIVRRPRRDKLSLRLRIGLIFGGALIGWAVPIACAATLL